MQPRGARLSHARNMEHVWPDAAPRLQLRPQSFPRDDQAPGDHEHGIPEASADDRARGDRCARPRWGGRRRGVLRRCDRAVEPFSQSPHARGGGEPAARRRRRDPGMRLRSGAGLRIVAPSEFRRRLEKSHLRARATRRRAGPQGSADVDPLTDRTAAARHRIMNAAKGVSVVVPTWGRPQLVASLLASLCDARSAFDGSSEVVVVDSSEAREAALIRNACERFDARYLAGPVGVHQKRNAGVRAACHDLLFFIDSDCEATAGVLRTHAAIHDAGDARLAGVCGLTQLVGVPTNGWQAAETAGSFTAAFDFARWLREVPWATCTNFSLRRDVFERLGGFDETLPGRLYGEDVDLGLRLTGGGYTIRSAADAVVLHNRVASFNYGAALRKAMLSGRADVALGIRHPDRLALEFPRSVT